MIRVILCSHNGERFLEAQVASIMEQSRPVDVVHLFDFASADGTRALLDRLAFRWPKLDVHLVDEAPGVTLSFFHGFSRIAPICEEDDVIFLSDQDDVWLPDKVRHMVALVGQLRGQGYDRILAFHDVDVCDETLNVIRRGVFEGKPFRLPRDLSPERLLIANPIIGHSVVLTPALVKLALTCLRPAKYVMHDWALVLLAAYGGRLAYRPERLGLYRQHQSNILGATRRKSVRSYLRRGLQLSREVHVQAEAFAADMECARKMGLASVTRVLPGPGPIALRLASVMMRRGPTIWHKVFGILQIRNMLPRRS